MMVQVLNSYVSSKYPLLEVVELYHRFPAKKRNEERELKRRKKDILLEENDLLEHRMMDRFRE